MFLLPTFSCGIWLAEDPAARELEEARAFYAGQPEILRPFDYSPVPEGLKDLSAETCGSCHQSFYEEWRISTHARAWLDDAQFQEELNKPEFNGSQGRDTRWMCVNCHTPLENQLERLVTSLENGALDKPVYMKNPHFDEKLQLEAVTCAACHVRDGFVLGPYGAGGAPHPVKKAPELLSVQVCVLCHQANASFPEITLACMFDTGRELAESSYGEKGYTCQMCHMPEVERPLVADGPPRKTRRHWFGGSLIPKHPDFSEEVAALESIFPDGMTARWLSLPEQLVAGRSYEMEVEIANRAAGHLLPTGDPERYIDILVEVVDPAGNVLAERKHRVGTVIQWHPEIVMKEDNRLKPLETRILNLGFVAPEHGPLALRIRADKNRISDENFEYHNLEGRSVQGRRFIDQQTMLPVVR